MLKASVFSTAAFQRTVPEDGQPSTSALMASIGAIPEVGAGWHERRGHRHERPAAQRRPVGASGSGTLFVAWHCLIFGASAFGRARCVLVRIGLVRGARVFFDAVAAGLFRAVATLLNEVLSCAAIGALSCS